MVKSKQSSTVTQHVTGMALGHISLGPYYLLLQQKGRKQRIALPPPKAKPGESQVVASPTIHASLEHNLDLSGLEDSPDVDFSPNSFRSGSSISEQFRRTLEAERPRPRQR
ncbi:hypothetical protein COOONC_13721 [Cooperia oncophora]